MIICESFFFHQPRKSTNSDDWLKIPMVQPWFPVARLAAQIVRHDGERIRTSTWSMSRAMGDEASKRRRRRVGAGCLKWGVSINGGTPKWMVYCIIYNGNSY